MFVSTLLTTLLAPIAPGDTVAKRFSLLPIPAVYYTPETRLAFGFGLTATFRFKGDSGKPAMPTPGIRAMSREMLNRAQPLVPLSPSRPSQISLGAAYTQNKQLLFFAPFQVFFDQDNYYINGEIGYYRYSYYFYGVGQRDLAARELYGVNFINTRLNVFRRIANLSQKGKLYAGVRHQYEDFRVTTVVPDGVLASQAVAGGRGSRRTSFGLGLFYDSRDQVFFPSKGVIVDLAYLYNRWTASGAHDLTPTTYNRYVADVSSYHPLAGRKAILAMNYVVSFTDGLAPFSDLSMLGSSKRMRGYYEGRYRDQNIALLQSEVRFDIYKRLGGVVFGAVGLMGDEQQLLRTSDPKAAYGAGLRFTVNRRDHVNIRIDYGIGKQSSGFYLTIGEAF